RLPPRPAHPRRRQRRRHATRPLRPPPHAGADRRQHMTTTTPPTDGPLTGLRVLDCSTILAGPLTCQILGDFGADVIKVEHPQHGDGMRGHGPGVDGVGLWWKEIARNKRTIGLNLGHPDGAEIALQLARTADVLVENFRPGTLERWGLGWDRLQEVNPA